jgi:hypothetical protein
LQFPRVPGYENDDEKNGELREREDAEKVVEFWQ